MYYALKAYQKYRDLKIAHENGLLECYDGGGAFLVGTALIVFLVITLVCLALMIWSGVLLFRNSDWKEKETI